MVRSYSGSGSYTLQVDHVSAEIEEGTLAESPHPYSNNYERSWTIEASGAERVRVHFSRLETERNYDYVRVCEEDGTVVKSYTGTHNNTWSPWVEGDKVVVKLETDYSVTAYGFVVDRKETQSADEDQSFGYIRTGSNSTYGVLQSSYMGIHIDQEYADEIVANTAHGARILIGIGAIIAGAAHLNGPAIGLGVAAILDSAGELVADFSFLEEGVRAVLTNSDGSMDIVFRQVFGDLVMVQVGNMIVPAIASPNPCWLIPGFSLVQTAVDIQIGTID
jgi:hypothetical protein